MGQILHGSATTTEAIRRAIQHSHVWTAPADQGFIFGDGVVAGAVMSPACCCGLMTAPATTPSRHCHPRFRMAALADAPVTPACRHNVSRRA